MRALKACLLVVLVIAVVPAGEVVFKASAADVDNPAPLVQETSPGLSGEWKSDYGKPEEALGKIEAQLSSLEAALPEEVVREVPILPGAKNLRFDNRFGVLSFECGSSSEKAYAQSLALMEQKGWKAVPLGGVIGATFIKEKGDYRWALMTFSEFEGESVAVLRLPLNSAS